MKKENLPIVTYKSNCPVVEDCPFYRKDNYNKDEMYFYLDHCLRGGEGCGLKRNHDITEKLKERNKRRLE